jgi:hypothetical protein
VDEKLKGRAKEAVGALTGDPLSRSEAGSSPFHQGHDATCQDSALLLRTACMPTSAKSNSAKFG